MSAIPTTLRPLCAGSTPASGRAAAVCRASPARPAPLRLPGAFLGTEGLSSLRTPTPSTRSQRAKQAGSSRGSSLVMASFLGVGAPEAVMVGVVALVVFGPKGLAEAAKSLGQAAKSVAPTVRELASVSQDLKNTIEDEIGLDDIKRDFQSVTDLNPSPRARPLPGTEAEGTAAVSADVAKVLDPEIEQKRKEAAAAAWGGEVPQALAAEDSAAESPGQPQGKDLSSMSVEELQTEIARRKAAAEAENK